MMEYVQIVALTELDGLETIVTVETVKLDGDTEVRQMKKSIGVVHSQFKCETCGVEYGWYKNAQALGAKHAKTYGHVVRGEVGIAVTYDGTDEVLGK